MKKSKSDSTVDLDGKRIAQRLALEADESCLVVMHGDELGRHHRLCLDSMTVIGRDEECGFVLAREDVSRRHAELRFEEGRGWVLRDLGSRNGVFVDGVRVRDEADLAHGQLIAIGGAVLKYVSGRAVEARFHEEMYQLTVRDGLTGLHNRRYLVEFLEREVARANRHHRRLSTALIDADRFKKVNDTYGHLAGDRLLRQLADRIMVGVRREQLLARYGGEEFCLVLPEQALAMARTFCEKIRLSIADRGFDLGNQDATRVPMTVSIGVAELQPGEEAAGLLGAADQALYGAKVGGRNQVVARAPDA